MSFNKYIHPRNHHNQDAKNLQHPERFPSVFALLVPPLLSGPRQTVIFLSLEIKFAFFRVSYK